MARILFLEQFSEMGGGQRNLLDLLPAVIARGWKAAVAAPGTGDLLQKACKIGAEALQIRLGDYSAGKKTPTDAARFFYDTISLGRWIAKQEFDLLSAGGARLMPAVARGARGRPVIFQAQHYLGKSYAVNMTNRAIARCQATVIANSKHVASQFPNAQVVYNGVAETPFRERSFRTAPRIGIIGRIAPMKGQTDFLRAAAIVHRQMPEAKFVICGAPMFTAQAYVDEVHRLAENLPVEFLGWRDDIANVLHDLDLLVAPSTAAEATTRVILEAFSAGVPVVAYAIGGIPEIVRDDENGFLVPECNPPALAQRISKLFAANQQAVVQRARNDFCKRFTIDRYQREMTDIMARVIRGPETASANPRSA